MVEQEIRVPTADGEMTVFTVHPDGDGPYPIAVLYMDGVGYRKQVMKNARDGRAARVRNGRAPPRLPRSSPQAQADGAGPLALSKTRCRFGRCPFEAL
jgi:hypothetical protein